MFWHVVAIPRQLTFTSNALAINLPVMVLSMPLGMPLPHSIFSDIEFFYCSYISCLWYPFFPYCFDIIWDAVFTLKESRISSLQLDSEDQKHLSFFLAWTVSIRKSTRLPLIQFKSGQLHYMGKALLILVVFHP